jgi:predicted nucleic acid-binding protein
MLIIADSSALNALATCQGLDILLRLYDDVRVPNAVYVEVAAPEKPWAAILLSFLSGRVEIVDMTHWVLAAGDLGQGEIEAMALYKQLSADALLIDDRRARLIAEHNQIHCVGALGVLPQAKQLGAIERVAPFVEKLRASQIYYRDDLFSKVLEVAGE